MLHESIKSDPLSCGDVKVDTQNEDSGALCKELYHLIENPEFLFFGMPDRAKHFFEMNVAQPPQGPMLKSSFSFLPESLRDLINKKFEKAFNPERESAYSGLNLIRQNLEEDLPGIPVKLIDHPTRDEILDMIDDKYFPLIGISIGCENQIRAAEKLVQEIQAKYAKWSEIIKFLLHGKNICPEWMHSIPGLGAVDSAMKKWAFSELKKRFGEQLTLKICENPDLLDDLAPTIVLGNYGASAAKKLFGDRTPLNSKVTNAKILWDDIDERKEKRKKDEEPYIGEGVHDMRLFLKNLGYKVLKRPKDPIVSKVVEEPDSFMRNKFKKRILSTMGIFLLPYTKVTINTAVGCKNQCSFCNTSAHFQREKSYLFKDVDAMFQSILEKVLENENDPGKTDEISVWVLDENLGQTPESFERMCELVVKSKKLIRWGTSTDIKSLYEYRIKHGDFRELARGGLNSLWLGIESKDDFFNKRGDAGVGDIESMIQELQSLGISVIGSFIVGLPIHTEGETKIQPDGTHEKLNIHEDMQWWRRLNTSANQVMMNTDTNLLKGKNAFSDRDRYGPATPLAILDSSDWEFGHITINNKTDIPDDRLEQIDRMARREFFQENGPVVIRTLMVWWNGFLKFRNSDDHAERNMAVSNYWMCKRSLHVVSLSTVFFSEMFFEKCSDAFLERLACFLKEVEACSPPESPLNEKFQKLYDIHNQKISGIAKTIAEYLRNNFVKKNGNLQSHQKHDELAIKPFVF